MDLPSFGTMALKYMSPEKASLSRSRGGLSPNRLKSLGVLCTEDNLRTSQSGQLHRDAPSYRVGPGENALC